MGNKWSNRIRPQAQAVALPIEEERSGLLEFVNQLWLEIPDIIKLFEEKTDHAMVGLLEMSGHAGRIAQLTAEKTKKLVREMALCLKGVQRLNQVFEEVTNTLSKFFELGRGRG